MTKAITIMKKEVIPYVDKKYAELVPRPNKDQRDALKESIIKEGQKEPIIVNNKGKIIDGFTRFQICRELHLKPKFEVREFDNIDVEKNYAITVNLKRRHLNDYQIYELFKKQIDMIKNHNASIRSKKMWESKKGLRKKGDYRQKVEDSTQFKASQLTGLGMGTLEAIRYIQAHGDKQLLEQVKKGDIGVYKAMKLTKQKLKEPLRKNYQNFRSKIGIVFDIIKSIEDSKDGVRLNKITSLSHVPHDRLQTYVNLLMQTKLLRVERKIYRREHYKTSTRIKLYHLTPKGFTFYKECIKLNKYLVKELQN